MVFLSEFPKDGVCLGKRMSTILFKKKEMTHFASGGSVAFAVQVEPHLRMGQEAIPPGLSPLP
jgi:hypothetical protein